MARKTILLLLCACAAALVGGATARTKTARQPAVAPPFVPATAQLRPEANPWAIRRYRREAWRWETLMGRRLSRGSVRPYRHVLKFWHDRALRRRRDAVRVPHKGAWLCIHRYEAGWTDSGDPYWGGLQMDRGFMSTYAPRMLLRRGWADRWTAIEQMWVAERALRRGRGFYPWPNTARVCGVL